MSAPAWPALPEPGRMIRLPLPCPGLLELAGYKGNGRLVALWWTALGDELLYSDGTTTATAPWRVWLALLGHPLSGALLNPYQLGSSDREADHRLFVDRQLQTLDVGLALDVEQLLATQPSELQALTADMTEEELEDLVDRGRDAWRAREIAKTPRAARP